MTEEEAKTKWCPHGLVGHHESGLGGFNRDVAREDDGRFERATRCIASACMAWQWRTDLNMDPNPESPLHVTSATHGGCGLAGGAQ